MSTYTRTTRDGSISIGDTVKVVRSGYYDSTGKYVGQTGKVVRIGVYSSLPPARDDVSVLLEGREEAEVFEACDLEKVTTKFNIGDRVIVKDSYHYGELRGRSGVVVDHSDLSPLIRFEGFEGHSGNGFARGGDKETSDHWFVGTQYLVLSAPLYDPMNPKVGDVVAYDFGAGINRPITPSERSRFRGVWEIVAVYGSVNSRFGRYCTFKRIDNEDRVSMFSARFRAVTAAEHKTLVAPYAVKGTEEDKKTTKLSVGDVVVVLKDRNNRPELIGRTGKVVRESNFNSGEYLIEFDGWKRGHGLSDNRWYLNFTDGEIAPAPSKTGISATASSVFKGKHWILCLLDKDGKPLPAERPRTYSTEQQARTVAYEMAEKHAGCVFAIYEMTAYSAEETFTVDVLKTA